jgi:hypothetical protein
LAPPLYGQLIHTTTPYVDTGTLPREWVFGAPAEAQPLLAIHGALEMMLVNVFVLGLNFQRLPFLYEIK